MKRIPILVSALVSLLIGGCLAIGLGCSSSSSSDVLPRGEDRKEAYGSPSSDSKTSSRLSSQQERLVIFAANGRNNFDPNNQEAIRLLTGTDTQFNSIAVWREHHKLAAALDAVLSSSDSSPGLKASASSYYQYVHRPKAAWEAAKASPSRFKIFSVRTPFGSYFSNATDVKQFTSPSTWYNLVMLLREDSIDARLAGHPVGTMIDSEMYGANTIFKKTVDEAALRSALKPARDVLGGVDIAVPYGISTNVVAPTSSIISEVLAKRLVYPVYYHSYREWRLREVTEKNPNQIAQLVTEVTPELSAEGVGPFTPAEVVAVIDQNPTISFLVWVQGPETNADWASAYVDAFQANRP